jgi:hypothetical protein
MPEIIIISKGKEYPCLYDQEDKELINRFSWSLHSKGYAMTTISGKTVLMHRLIMGVLDKPGIEIDHRYHNRMDNQRSMLRVCTHSENQRNSRKLKESAHSKYKGIYLDEGRWHTQIFQDSRVRNLGRYGNEVLAAKVYDSKALQVFGAFAFINFQSSREARQLQFPWIQ